MDVWCEAFCCRHHNFKTLHLPTLSRRGSPSRTHSAPLYTQPLPPFSKILNTPLRLYAFTTTYKHQSINLTTRNRCRHFRLIDHVSEYRVAHPTDLDRSVTTAESQQRQLVILTKQSSSEPNVLVSEDVLVKRCVYPL